MERKKGKKFGRFVLLVTALMIFLACGVGTTTAYLAAKSGRATNVFTYAVVESDITEQFDNVVKKDVRIQNNGNIDAFIRSTILVLWKDKKGNVFWKEPRPVYDYHLDLDLSEGWFQNDADGYYYWKKAVPPKAFTGILVKSCRQNDSADVPDGYSLSVEILADAIQAEPLHVVEEIWDTNVINGEVSP